MMKKELSLYNTLSRSKEVFAPLNPPMVGMYVCGPTVYGDPHLGHARSAITFDVVYRYLEFLGYKVRYVRNITDVGHLEHDADEGEDKIAKKAKLEKLEPMEVVQFYTHRYHQVMDQMNVRRPSIEPHASGHIPEQIKLIEDILSKGLAYEVNGSVYFDVEAYSKAEDYGCLSGRVLEDLQANTRELEGQQEKKHPYDFALWKKASPSHIMRWDSPWSVGFPGWHLECSAMSAKYLGTYFDIHGGGMDLMFPHHECEIAQAKAGHSHDPAKYWLHNNMITINGQKMGKSLGNFITMEQLFSGNHELLERSYSPMTIRFFILQAHYRSTLDFSNEALIAAGKGYKKLINGLRNAKSLVYTQGNEILDAKVDENILRLSEKCFDGLNDDFNTAVTIANLFNLLKKINSISTGQLHPGKISQETFDRMKNTFIGIVEDVLGLYEEKVGSAEGLIDGLLEIYREAKANKDFEKVDKIRAYFKKEGLVIKDMKHSIDWAYEE
ncbi:cysteine--tRNA ligase [Cytophagaceae bacterium ABcell3]|nr:cysteine--tRNA ligase [Cytophagaceae bacterium ABcell3]